MYKIIYFFSIPPVWLLLHSTLYSQAPLSITIDECYQWAEDNYPLIKQLDLIEQAKVYNIKNASKGFYPQISINSQASYQSDVTELSIDLPDLEVPTIDKDQYKIYTDIYLPLTNGASIKTQKRQIEASSEIEKKQVEIDLYQLKERVNQLFFGILLIDARSEQLELLQEDINSALQKTNAAIANGTATETDAQLLNAELLHSVQQLSENNTQKQAYLRMLSDLTHQAFTDATVLVEPNPKPTNDEINRLELSLFDLQSSSFDIQAEQIKNNNIPSVGLFFQGGYGRPALNLLSNNFDTYYTGGVKLNWNLSKLYTTKNDRQLIQLNKRKVDNQKEAFLLNTNLDLTQQSSEIDKYQSFINNDEELIAIRQSIKEISEVQLENGLISALDYISYINAESTARLNLVLHRTQLLMAQYHFSHISGN